ncbi:MAG: threonine-phosphate decarboxylase, partial [Cyanobacteria bacterium J06633_2]
MVSDPSQNRPKHGGNKAWAAKLANCSPSSILDVSASINPLGPPASAIAAIEDSMSSLRYYPDPDYRALREALGTFHGVDPDWIFPGNGAAEILTWIGRALAEQSAQFNS